MKKLINDPNNFVTESLEGLVAAHPAHFALMGERKRVISYPGQRKPNKVGVVSGGGSGHMPVFTGYVGAGMLDACSIGEVFAGPNVQDCVDAIKFADQGAGVLCLFGNYGGDKMNFAMASEFADDDDIDCQTVLVADDVASASLEEHAKRRGVAGMVFAFKVAGAAADAGLSLSEVAMVTQRAADNTRSLGVALSSLTLPQVGTPSFEIAEDEIEIGMGIHGEPGIRREKLREADDIVQEIVDRILADHDLSSGDRVAILVNSLGSTPHEELFIIYRKAAAILADKGIEIAFSLVGRYATSMEMAGASVSLMKLDDEIEKLLNAPTDCVFWGTSQ